MELFVPEISAPPGGSTSKSKPECQNFKEIKLVNRYPDRFPSSCLTTVRIAWSPAAVWLCYLVREKQIRALETTPLLIHKDSCVEFFFILPGKDRYFNFESNPAGRFLFAVGPNRHERQDLTETAGQSISIQGSHVGREPFDESGESWELEVKIPAEAVGLEHWSTGSLKANLYKCGDYLEAPHYATWNPPTSEDPDFHRPEDFGTIYLS